MNLCDAGQAKAIKINRTVHVYAQKAHGIKEEKNEFFNLFGKHRARAQPYHCVYRHRIIVCKHICTFSIGRAREKKLSLFVFIVRRVVFTHVE